MSNKVVYSRKKGGKTASGNSKRPKASQRRPLNRHKLEAPDPLDEYKHKPALPIQLKSTKLLDQSMKN